MYKKCERERELIHIKNQRALEIYFQESRVVEFSKSGRYTQQKNNKKKNIKQKIIRIAFAKENNKNQL